MRHDIFDNVHKGLRRALFAACVAIGRAGEDPERAAEASRLTREVLRFVHHHGENEDLLLLPLLEARAPDAFARATGQHARLTAELHAVEAALANWEADPTADTLRALYHEACAFTASYLAHMRDEEIDLYPVLVAALTPEELVGFGRGSVARTAPADQHMMIGHMLPAMTREDALAFLGRVPPAVAEELRGLVG